MLKIRRISLILVCICSLWLPEVLHAEQLRLLVPRCIGPNPLSQYIRTTIYFDLVKAFKHRGSVDKGGWILYGLDELSAPTHDAAISAASWPSVRADLVIWGKVYRYDEGAAVQLYLTVTPIIDTRQIRPELWRISTTQQDGKAYSIELDIPSRYYEFEPILLPSDVVIQYEKPEGIPLYSKRKGGVRVGSLGKLISFDEIYDDAIHVKSDNKEGWIRTGSIRAKAGEVTDFVKGFVRLLRGDWEGTLDSFTLVLNYKNIPQDLRIHSLIYYGLAKEKAGLSGIKEFEAAYQLNPLDKGAASYLLMSRISAIIRAKQQGNQGEIETYVYKLKKEMDAVKILFGSDDKWFQEVSDFL